MAVLALAPTWAMPAAAQAAKLCHVNAHVAGQSHDGATWASAYADLQEALTNPECSTIWVAQGTYKPTHDNDRFASFNIKEGMKVYGGFAGHETELDQRDFTTYPTILSGDIGAADHDADNSNHVVFMDGRKGANITSDTILDGFLITKGHASSWGFFNYEDSYGGGLYCDGSGSGNECSPTLSNITFSDNHAGYYGGALYNNGGNGGASSPSLIHVTFSGNSANSNGGAIYTYSTGGTSSPSLAHVVFTDNRAHLGGAMYIGSFSGATTSPRMTDVTFNDNRAHLGGAVYSTSAMFSVNTPILKNVTFSHNDASGFGGAMFNSASDTASFTIPDDSRSNPVLSHVTFVGNTAEVSGGALFYEGGHAAAPTLIDAHFSGNKAGADDDIGF